MKIIFDMPKKVKKIRLLNKEFITYEKKLLYSKKLGYSNLAEAIDQEGKENFKTGFKLFLNNQL